MAGISLLLAGGMKQDKATKIIQTLSDGLRERKIESSIDFINLFEVSDLSKYEPNHDIIVNVSTKNLNTRLPVVQGLGLMYPWMGTDKLYEEINKIVE